MFRVEFIIRISFTFNVRTRDILKIYEEVNWTLILTPDGILNFN